MSQHLAGCRIDHRNTTAPGLKIMVQTAAWALHTIRPRCTQKKAPSVLLKHPLLHKRIQNPRSRRWPTALRPDLLGQIEKILSAAADVPGLMGVAGRLLHEHRPKPRDSVSGPSLP